MKLNPVCAIALVAAVLPATPTVADAQTVVGISVGGAPEGAVPRTLFGVDLFWANDAEGAFDAKTHEFYPGFVAELRRLGVGAVRYPGGTTSDSFQWQRAVGPLRHRQANEPYGALGPGSLVDGPEASVVGPDEFGHLLNDFGAQGTITVNFATGTAQEAADWVAYMTAPLPKSPVSDPSFPGYWAKLRARDGHPAPYDVPYWEVGNEQFSPAQFGWRSGSMVSYGPGASTSALCQPGTGYVQSCLYVFGGTTAFVHEAVGTFADELPSATYSTGRPGQRFFAYYPPVEDATVFVSGHPWRVVRQLSSVGPAAHVYTLNAANGEIRFGGDGRGAAPPRGAKVTVSYESGPHDGFIEFYNAMKAMNPSAQVCESEGLDATFMEIAGSEDPYDCVVMHGYMPAPSPGLPLATYEQDLMSVPVADTYYLVNLQEAARYYSGHDVPVVMTEYGQPVWPPPDGDVSWNLSMGEALLTAAQVMEWAYHGVALAEKQLAVSEPFDGALRDADLAEELSATNGVIADVGPRFLVEPPGLALGLLSKLAGGELLPVSMSNDPYIGTPTPAFMGGQYATEVWAIAAQAGQQLFVALVNASPDRAVLTQLDLPISAGPHQATVWSLNGAALASYNSPARPNQVEVVRTETVIPGPVVTRELPAHSVNVLMLQA